MTVFVTDGDQRPALTIVRALGRRGISTIVGDEQPVSLASSSRFCARRVAYPSPYRQPDAFQRFLVDFVSSNSVDVVIPVTDVTTRAVCTIQRELGRHCALAVPPLDAFDIVTHKGKLAEHAARCGVATPRTLVVDGIAGLEAVLDRIEYPAVVKPVQSRLLTARGWVSGTVHYAHSADELRRLYAEHEYLARHQSLVQERIVGPGVGVFMLFDRGRPVAEFAHRRLREKPPAGGASVLSESTAVDPELRAHTVRMLGPLGWHGVAMTEYKQDERSGKFLLIEVNGRFWGSLQLAVDAGVDFPFLAYQLALGRRAETDAPYTVGLKNRWLWGDVDHLLMRLFRSRRALDLPAGAPSRWRALADFLKFADPRVRYEIVSRDDLRPFFYELRENVKGLSAAGARLAAALTSLKVS